MQDSCPAKSNKNVNHGLFVKCCQAHAAIFINQKLSFIIIFFFNRVTICQAQVVCASDRLVVINFLFCSLLKLNMEIFLQGLWGVTWQPVIICFHLAFLQEKRWCKMMSSPVTSSASFNCFVKDIIQVCGQAASQLSQGDGN